MVSPEDVTGFWLDEIEPKQWYIGSEALDQTIRDRFQDAWSLAKTGGLAGWLTQPASALAYVILLDQFPRNMFRDHADAFSTDRRACAVAKQAIGQGFDLKIIPREREFMYMPLMHSECLTDQDRCVRLFADRLPDAKSSLLHAKAHREVIRRYGRFPTRNKALGRNSSADEQTYLDDGGYGAIVKSLEVAA